ncbi:MAG: response regulator, partial [Kofleriaceae bacterium]
LVHFDTTITPIVNAKGETTHHLGVKRDITEQIERQQVLLEAHRALQQARDTAVAASRAKSDFLANMSHELRTPLNAIIGYSEMLIEDASGDEQTLKDLNRIRSAGTHLLALINDILDISKIEANKVQLTPETFSLADLIESVAATIEPLANKNHNKFVVRCERGVGMMFADRTRLRQILFNLLSNACKFTKQGEIELSVTPLAGSRVELKIRDSGIGISPEQQAKLFQPFVQADSSTTREYGGTGLGLVICRRLVELMGGTIALTSAVGSGTMFTVELPTEVVGSSAEIRLPVRDGRATPLVLMIDDDPDVRDLFKRTMSRRGFDVEVAGTGTQGVELAARLRPDVIVLDVKMPGMSGWDVLSALKLADRTAHIPVIMLTVMQEQAVGQALGAVDYLIKPLDPDRLTATVRRHLRVATPARVLVVEDDEPTRALIARTLAAAGHRVTTAENGRIGLDRVDEATPDIVILDLMMPVMDGFTFLHHLRRQPEHSKLPVIVATARELSVIERQALEATAQRVITKQSHTREQLLSLISEQIATLVEDRASE